MKKTKLKLVLDGEVFLEETKGKKVISKEPIDGKIVLKLVLYALKRGIDLVLVQK